MATPGFLHRSGLESLPLELITDISNRLNISDLKRFRMVCRTTAKAVFERMVGLMPKAITVHGKRKQSLLDLAYRGGTFKMRDAVTRLSVVQMRPGCSHLLGSVKLPGLICLRLADGVVEGGGCLIRVLDNHAASLRQLEMTNLWIVVTWEVMMRAKARLQSWRRLAIHLDSPSSGFQLRHRSFVRIGYIDPDRMAEIWLYRPIRRRRRKYSGLQEFVDGNLTSRAHAPEPLEDGSIEELFVDD